MPRGLKYLTHPLRGGARYLLVKVRPKASEKIVLSTFLLTHLDSFLTDACFCATLYHKPDYVLGLTNLARKGKAILLVRMSVMLLMKHHAGLLYLG